MNCETTGCESRDIICQSRVATQYGKAGIRDSHSLSLRIVVGFSGTLGIRHLLTSFRQWRAATMTQKTQRKTGPKTHEDLSKSFTGASNGRPQEVKLGDKNQCMALFRGAGRTLGDCVEKKVHLFLTVQRVGKRTLPVSKPADVLLLRSKA
ncbi:hypothetical protein GW17_00027293 [Ensete ventricosum]|uniref:Uncharacterized protein n=1 Tax=Ensete ventricosum TaxID=4639 RepID=A0A444EFW0_ENSVE|nr:hypothetical protein B296_00012664 [Ensete ventricosum]RWW09225.1 hypothetical protein GW17_00027293 [Ensete ventricosum]